MKFQASFSGATLSKADVGCTFPASFDVTLQTFAVAVWNRAAPTERAELGAAPKATLHLTRTSAGLTSATCAASANSFALGAGAGVTDAAINILTTHDAKDNTPNDASAKAEITSPDDSLGGCDIAFVLGDASLTLSDFH